MLYVPEGYAHGFLVLSDIAEIVYKCTDVYDPTSEGGIPWNFSYKIETAFLVLRL